MPHRRAAAATLAIALGVAAGLIYRDMVWRAAYPYLPRRVQAVPYKLAALRPTHGTPIPLPTPGDQRPATDAHIGGAEETGGFVETSPTAASSALTGTAAPLDGSSVVAGRASAVPRPTGPQATPSPPPAAVPSLPAEVPSLPAEVPSLPAEVPNLPSEVPNLPSEVHLPDVPHQYQTWNNCGPATLAMTLDELGLHVDQAQTAKTLKPDPNDKNVSPDELAAYARGEGFTALVRVNGTIVEAKQLLAEGVPVITETWFEPEPRDEMGHYVLLSGYVDSGSTGEFVARDSYRGPGVRLPYEDFDADWRAFNRTLVVVYPEASAEIVDAILGERMDDARMYQGAAARALTEIQERGDAFAWFNLGSSLVGLEDAKAAADAYDKAREIGLPWRMLWYQFGPYEAYAQVGRWDDVMSLARATLANASNLEESQYWLGRAMASSGDAAGARAAYAKALHYNPNYAPARQALEGSLPEGS